MSNNQTTLAKWFHKNGYEPIAPMDFYRANKTCKEDGPKRTFEASADGDVVRKRLKQIETARRMRKSRNKGDRDIEKEFLEWKHAMNWKRREYESGGISPEQFLTWLEDHKSYTEDWDYE